MTLARRLEAAVVETPLHETFPAFAESFLELRSKDSSAERMSDDAVSGLARVIASSGDAARFLARRPRLLERLASADAGTLRERSHELLESGADPGSDLEQGLDSLRLLRRDETMFAACLDLGGIVEFGEVSTFLSCVAEAIVGRALGMARAQSRSGGAGDHLGVVGMGKIAGREMTYHSDLDLIFLLPEEDANTAADASRTAQRLIAYLTTMTGAGTAYAVDSRLRPSGRQGALVATFGAYERYQENEAAIWEHLALTRTRAIAGEIVGTQGLLARVRDAVLGAGRSAWPEIAEMRRRVQEERGGDESSVSIKTGPGGIMEVDFLATGGVLERGSSGHPGDMPSIPAMLAGLGSGPRWAALREDYAFLRHVEARARWAADRAAEGFSTAPDSLAVLAELVEPGLGGDALLDRVGSARARNRAAWESVVGAGSVRALG